MAKGQDRRYLLCLELRQQDGVVAAAQVVRHLPVELLQHRRTKKKVLVVSEMGEENGYRTGLFLSNKLCTSVTKFLPRSMRSAFDLWSFER